MRTYRITMACPGEEGDEGIRALGSVTLTTSDEYDGELIEMTEHNLRDVADALRILHPHDVCFCAVSPDKTSAGEGLFPFTHYMLIDDEEWAGPRDWLVTLDDDPRGDIIKPSKGDGERQQDGQ